MTPAHDTSTTPARTARTPHHWNENCYTCDFQEYRDPEFLFPHLVPDAQPGDRDPSTSAM